MDLRLLNTVPMLLIRLIVGCVILRLGHPAGPNKPLQIK